MKIISALRLIWNTIKTRRGLVWVVTKGRVRFECDLTKWTPASRNQDQDEHAWLVTIETPDTSFSAHGRDAYDALVDCMVKAGINGNRS